jgi:hypothetical protein
MKMKKMLNAIKDANNKAILKSYLRAVLASAITMAIALTADMEPQYAVLIGSIAAPLVKWADKAEKEFGLVAKKKK